MRSFPFLSFDRVIINFKAERRIIFHRFIIASEQFEINIRLTTIIKIVQNYCNFSSSDICDLFMIMLITILLLRRETRSPQRNVYSLLISFNSYVKTVLLLLASLQSRDGISRVCPRVDKVSRGGKLARDEEIKMPPHVSRRMDESKR